MTRRITSVIGLCLLALGLPLATRVAAQKDTQSQGGASTTEKLTATVSTAIHNSNHDVVSAVEVLADVHYFVAVTGAEDAPKPTGTVALEVFSSADCTEGLSESRWGLALAADGTVDVESFARNAGPMGILTHSSGDQTYGPADGICETVPVVDASITILPLNAVAEVNDLRTFTLTVTKNAGDGAGIVPAAGEHVDVRLDDDSGASHTLDATASTCDDSGPNTDANGQCVIVVTSPTTGGMFIVPRVTLDVDGLSIERDTDPGNDFGPPGNGSGEGTELWVDANITIGPTGGNSVNASHSFIVTVKGDYGEGYGLLPQPIGHVSFTLVSSGGANHVIDTTASTCDDADDNLDNNGQCTIVFTSPTSGTTIGNASVATEIWGKTITRDTDPDTATPAGLGGSGPATTTWTTPPEVAALARTGTATFYEVIMGFLMVIIGLTLGGAAYFIRRSGSTR